MGHQINGIQQLGVGVQNVVKAWEWFNRNYGMNVRILDDEAVAEFMLPHTEGKPRARRAIMALNLQGGGALEIWQHTGKEPIMPTSETLTGDLGINYGKMKTMDVKKTYDAFKEKGLNLISEVVKGPDGKEHFFVKDFGGNIWEFVQEESHFSNKGTNGGVFGAVIGVKDIEESLKVYRDILEYDTVVYDKEDIFEDWATLPGGKNRCRRMLLKKSKQAQGAFSPIFGPSVMELVQVLDREPKDIFEGRMWGDPGFIHLCFDIVNLPALRDFVASKGFPFTVDSTRSVADFDMGEAAGNFAYIQAPEGTLIEFVETLKVPIAKKFGLNINLKKRDASKPLPTWMLKMLAFKREKV